jgi:hypothetical protein
MFDYLKDHHHQKKVTRIALWTSSITLLFCGSWAFYWGVRGSNLETVKTLDYGSMVFGYAFLFFLLIALSAAAALTVCRKPKKQVYIRSYTSILFFWALVFVVIAIITPS